MTSRHATLPSTSNFRVRDPGGDEMLRDHSFTPRPRALPDARRRPWRASVNRMVRVGGTFLLPYGACLRSAHLLVTLSCSTSFVLPSASVALQGPGISDPFSGESLHLAKAVTIRGELVGDPELTAPRALLVDSGAIYVLDPTAHGVHRFDSLGRWLATIGSEGEGPGEFQRPTDMGWSADTLWVSDRELGRLSTFDRESGSVIRTVRFRVAGARHVTVPRRMLGSSILGIPQHYGTSAAGLDSVPLILFDEEGVVRDTLAWQAIGSGTVSILIQTDATGASERGTLKITHPFDLRSLAVADPRSRWMYIGTWRADRHRNADFELLKISGSGETVAMARLPFGRAPASRRDIDTYVRTAHEGLPRSIRETLTAREFSEQLARQVPRPVHTTIDAMVADEDGTVWFRKTAQGDAPSRSRWAAYRFGVGFLGFAVLPVGHRLLAASGGFLWTVIDDGLGIPQITGWTISWPAGIEE